MNTINRGKYGTHTRRGYSRRGGSLVEAIMGIFVGGLVLVSVAAVTVATSQIADKVRISNTFASTQQTATDEMMMQLRSANQVLASQTINGTTYTTGANGIVFSSPGYSSAGGGNILTSVSDYVAFTYDSASQSIQETVLGGSGSERPTRTRWKLAKNVTGVTFTYLVREQTSPTAATLTYTLKAAPSGNVTVYINGVKQTSGYSVNGSTVSLTGLTSGSDVQFEYFIPSSSTTALQYVTQVNAAVTVSLTDNRLATKTLSLSGAARLRNNRKDL